MPHRPVFVILALSTLAVPLRAQDSALEEIVVSARKREERALDVPVSVTVITSSQIEQAAIKGLADFAARTPGLSFAFGNGASAGEAGTAITNARTISIRGVAGARTTGIYWDETPLPASIDVRALDLAAIEVLKGPQGTLFGESSLGGNIRYVSREPNFSTKEGRVSLAGGWTKGGKGPAWDASAGGNMVLGDQSALRLNGFTARQPGYLTRRYPGGKKSGQGRQTSWGGSAVLGWQISDHADIKLQAAGAEDRWHGFPATYAPLPDFKPIGVLDHDANIQPSAQDRWGLGGVTIKLHGDSWAFTSATSYFRRSSLDIEDSTEGTARFWGTVIPQAFEWTARHRMRQTSHETRLQLEAASWLDLTAGFMHARSRNDFDIDPIFGLLGPSPGVSVRLWQQEVRFHARNTAIFGEIYVKPAERIKLTFGGRAYWMRQSDFLTFEYGPLHFPFMPGDDGRHTNKENGFNPRLAVELKPSDNSLVYASATRGFRAGGAQLNPTGFGCDASLAEIGQTPDSITRIRSDHIWSYEAGAKWQAESGLVLTASAWRIDWKDIQQPLFLASCAFYLQANAGAARINGGEFELAAPLGQGLNLRATLGLTDAEITRGGGTGQVKGDRVYQVPRWTGSLFVDYERALSEDRRFFMTAGAGYTGSSLSANAGPGANLKRRDYTLVSLRTGLVFGASEVALNVKNLTNARPNLGDIGYIGYARFEADNVTPRPQVMTLPPRTIMLEFSQRF